MLLREAFEAKLRNGLSVKISGRRPDANQCGRSEAQGAGSAHHQATQRCLVKTRAGQWGEKARVVNWQPEFWHD